MARIKIDYGIDLGTTNSAICRMEKGEPVVIKTDTLKDTLPSCVSVNKKGSVKAGDAALNALKTEKCRATKNWHAENSNTYVEFKRTMGTDVKYNCSNLGHELSSEELSAEVLKTLKSFVIDEDFHSVVITVPAKFTANQNAATKEAAKMAGFDHVELLQEPIAASFAYGLTSDQKDGIWMVFDFGGGTFDAALLRVEDGIMQVFDTEGDNYLGGKDLDCAIVDKIIVPFIEDNYSVDEIFADSQKSVVLKDALKRYAEEAKIQLSFKNSDDVIYTLGDLCDDSDGEEIDLTDLTITQEEVFDAMRPIFQKAVDICKALLRRNNLSGQDLSKLILVGGPTHSPLIRQMLREQITPNVDTSIDPMTAVATGAALYASTREAEVKENDIEVGTIKLNVGYESTSVELSEWVSVQLDKTDKSCPDSVMVEFVRTDNAWASGKTEVDGNGNVIEANLIEGRTNTFIINCYNSCGDRIPCFPSEITIIQGSKVGAAPLPYNIGIAVWDINKKKKIFKAATGLEKNKPLPAVGVINGLTLQSQLRPGVGTDIVSIPIYQCGDISDVGRSAELNDYVEDVVISGNEVDGLIPEDSPVDITIKVDDSQNMTVEAYFPSVDITVEKELRVTKRQNNEEAQKRIPLMIKDAQDSIQRLRREGVDTSSLQSDLDSAINDNNNSSEKEGVLGHLKKVLRNIEDLESGTEWERMEKDIRKEFERLDKANKDLGDDETSAWVEDLRKQTDSVVRSKNVALGRELLEKIDALFFRLTAVYQFMNWIRDFDETFESHKWKDSVRARQLVNRGLELSVDHPTAEQLRVILAQLFKLLPESEMRSNNGRKDLLGLN